MLKWALIVGGVLIGLPTLWVLLGAAVAQFRGSEQSESDQAVEFEERTRWSRRN